MDKGTTTEKTTYPTPHRTKRIVLQYAILIVSFIFLAGYENINPKLGESHVDFYLEQSKRLLELNSKAALLHPNEAVLVHQQIVDVTNAFYANRSFTPAWTINFSGTPQLDSLIHLIDSAAYFGIPKSIINSFRITSLLDHLENQSYEENKIGQRISLEIEASHTAFLFMTYLNRGIVAEDTSLSFKTYRSKLPHILENALNNNGLQTHMLNQQPTFKVYKKIITKLPEFLLSYKTVTTSVESITKTNLIEAFKHAGVLKDSDLDSVNTIQNVISDFQTHQKISATGSLNTETINKLGDVLSQKYFVLALNIDRLRKTSFNSNDFIYVNIPEFKLYAYAQNLKKREFNVVVGKKHTPTPTVSSELKKIVTNPYWTVPRSITRNELLPKIKNDSTFLQRNRYFIIDWKEDKVDVSTLDWESDDPFGNQYWLRQQYGRGNALGNVKFIFPNNYRVYLHDTPSKRLFSRDYRAYSHGCVRVQNPQKLAQYLSDTYIETDKSINIEASIASRKRQEHILNSNVEVHINYITCSVDEEGDFVYYNDIYKKDNKELESLFKDMALI